MTDDLLEAVTLLAEAAAKVNEAVAACSIEGCGRASRARGWCTRHYARWRRGTDLTAPGRDRAAKLAWLSQLVQTYPTGECVEWPWGCNDSGYAVLGKRRVASVVLPLAGQPRPDLPGYFGACALHSCDRPICVAPWHLRWGTHQENMDDIARRERNSSARLTWAAVDQIRTACAGGATQKSQAILFGVSKSQVSNIVTGRQWRETLRP